MERWRSCGEQERCGVAAPSHAASLVVATGLCSALSCMKMAMIYVYITLFCLFSHDIVE